ncbi:hypothetical protein OSB04_018917 [Centaurea solstitialis]|uniref:CCHC-type domain-containing protein n=1 Tax=Centaurea solstitialis TaxID=347529 RepID=A0AA38SPA2_9ASTR|nr:hypothetical protein OSB04_018917 [Centaurea solstitialis]
MANAVTNTNNLSLRSILEKDKLTSSNFLDWERNLMIVLRHERKWYVLEEPLGEAPPANALAAARNAHKKHSDDLLDAGCLMLATMSPDLQTVLINTNAYDMIRQLRNMFQTQARTERYDATKAFNECKMIKGTSVSDHVMKMKRHMDHLERLGHPVPLQLATDTILNSLSEDYKPFVINYNMNNMEKTIAELHSMLKTAELNMGAKNKTKDVLMVRDGGVKKKHGHGGTGKGKGPVQVIQSAPKVRDNIKGKGKGKKVKPNKARTENRCFTCNEVGHWRQNCLRRHEAEVEGPIVKIEAKMEKFGLELEDIEDLMLWIWISTVDDQILFSVGLVRHLSFCNRSSGVFLVGARPLTVKASTNVDCDAIFHEENMEVSRVGHKMLMKEGEHIVVIQIYVDDIIFGSTSRELCKKFETVMTEEFKMSMMGEINFFLGLQVRQFSDGIFINQSKYIFDLLKKYDMTGCHSIGTPMATGNSIGPDHEGKDVDLRNY